MGYAIGTMAMNVPAAKAWAAIADFGGLLTWMPPLEGSTLSTTGSGVGMVRTLSLPGLGAGDERLDANDHDNMIQVLSITTGGPFGASRYQARLSVRPAGADACTCFWEGFFALMRHSVDEGMTPASFLDAWTVADSVEEAMAQIQTGDAAPGRKHDLR